MGFLALQSKQVCGEITQVRLFVYSDAQYDKIYLIRRHSAEPLENGLNVGFGWNVDHGGVLCLVSRLLLIALQMLRWGERSLM